MRVEHIPESVFGREAQIDALQYLLRQAEKGATANGFVFGHSGCGKTATLKDVMKRLPGHRFAVVHVNCSAHRTPTLAIAEVMAQLGMGGATRGMQHHEVLQMLVGNMMVDSERVYVFIFDEIHNIEDADQLIYSFTRLDEAGKGVIKTRRSVICATTQADFLQQVESKNYPASASYQPTKVHFSDYTEAQLRQILMDRAIRGFSDFMCPPEVVARMAAVAAERGDARRAIELMRVAGERADKEGRPVRDDDVDYAASKAEAFEICEAVRALSPQSRAYLWVILECSRESKITTSTETYEKYRAVMAQSSMTTLTQRMCQGIVAKLRDDCLIETEAEFKGGRKTFISVPDEVREAIDGMNLLGGVA